MMSIPRRAAVGIFCAAIMGADSSVGAQSAPLDGVRLSMNWEHLNLEPPRAEELVGAGGGRARAPAAARAIVNGRGLRVELPPPVEPLIGALRRTLPRLWLLEVAPETPTPRVTLHLETPDGTRNRLACREDPRATVVAYLRPLAETSSIGPDGTVRVEGGAVLEIPTAELGVACRLDGRIVAVLEAW